MEVYHQTKEEHVIVNVLLHIAALDAKIKIHAHQTHVWTVAQLQTKMAIVYAVALLDIQAQDVKHVIHVSFLF